MEKGRRTAINSANYIAPLYIGRYSIRATFTNPLWVNQIGAVWGMQRNAPKGFSVDFNLGLVYTFNAQHYSNYYDSIEGLIQLRLGYWLGRK